MLSYSLWSAIEIPYEGSYYPEENFEGEKINVKKGEWLNSEIHIGIKF